LGAVASHKAVDFTTAAFGADEAQLALILKAQTDFDRVQLAAVPQLHDTLPCIQSQAALLPVATRLDVPLIRFRKGYCTLLGAVASHKAVDFTAAAADFDAAVQAWPARVEKPPKGVPIEPVSSALPVLAAVARLEADPSKADADAKAIESAVAQPACPASVMTVPDCQRILQIGKQWLGWIALRGNRLDEAARDFSFGGWPEWTAARQAFERRDFRKAAEQYRQAIHTWETQASQSAPPLIVRLGPQPDLGLALANLGGAQLLAGDQAAAIATLDDSIKRDSDHAWSFYLRARAKEISGQLDAALIDYNLAARTAFAGAKDLVSGEAHLYRGMLMYRRKDFPRAEDEFASALNFDIPANLRPDAVAWRHMAAVAGGACNASRGQLQRAMTATSPYFPKREAQAAIDSCPSTEALK
jgi:tetratricopeptide (TPR) repeat protein